MQQEVSCEVTFLTNFDLISNILVLFIQVVPLMNVFLLFSPLLQIDHHLPAERMSNITLFSKVVLNKLICIQYVLTASSFL